MPRSTATMTRESTIPGHLLPDSQWLGSMRAAVSASSAGSSLGCMRLQPNRVDRLGDVRMDASLDEDAVPDHEHEQRPNLAGVVVRPGAMIVEQPQRGGLVDEVVGL